MNKFVTFGEILMRLSPSGNKKLRQTNQLDFYYGGTEMNVAASLSNFGLNVQHIANVSNDFIGEMAIATLKQYGIDVSQIKKVNHPLGLYFLEVGSSMRSSQITYNRLHSAFANITPQDVNWDEVLLDCDYFHWTGISPAISEGAYLTLKKVLEAALIKGIIVTADPAYRSNLWNYGRKGPEVLLELISYSNIFIGGVNEINEILNTEYSRDKEGFISASKKLMMTCPSIKKIFNKIRIGGNASWQKIQGRGWTGSQYISSEELEITHVVDRIGTGDAFSAGLIYGLKHFDDQNALNFACSACALKHTIIGDVNLVNVEEVIEIANGNISGRIKR